MTTQQVKKELPKFWNRRQTFYISVLCISAAILVTAVLCVVSFKQKPISRSLLKEVTVQVDALTQQNLQFLYDQQLAVQSKDSMQTLQSADTVPDTVPDLVAAIIKTTHKELPNLKRVLTEMQNVTFVISK
uniref:Uncharacterized protein n=1 Tax=Daphnia galeata TaxID=27404 RepID=A0A8J2RHD0_9CRUS|nr:unnamed protein product [Daphnia galeata]